jgi:hypothetical protein
VIEDVFLIKLFFVDGHELVWKGGCSRAGRHTSGFVKYCLRQSIQTCN